MQILAPYLARLRPWVARGLIVLAMAVPGVVGLGIKRKLLTESGGGFDLVAAVLGLSSGRELPGWQRVTLYRWDAIIWLIAVPVLWVVATEPLRRGARAALTAVVSILLSLILFVELKTYWEVGTFLPLQVLASGAIGAGRAFIPEYLTSGSVAKLGVLVLATLVAAGMAWLADRAGRATVPTGARRATVLGGFAMAGVLAAPVLPGTPFDRSAARLALAGFVGGGHWRDAEESPRQSEASVLVSEYARLAHAPVPNVPSAYAGRARGYNVLVYLYETLPRVCYDLPEQAGTFATFRSRESHAFVATRHLATYPYSRRAYFSIYSGWYPPNAIRDVTDLAPGDSLHMAGGMVMGTRLAGYRTAAFVPEAPVSWERDTTRYRLLGFEEHVVPANGDIVTDELREAVERRIAHQRPQDDSARAMLRAAITKAARDSTPWLFAFNPQLTHGPWPGVEDATSTRKLCAAAAPLFAEVDRGLADVLATLEETGQRERTLVVVLGDHGVRNRREYPGLRGSTIEEITYNVPMLIAAPGVIEAPVRIEATTSHIDLAPSVLDLLGLNGGRQLEQGSPMWADGLEQRRVFVFGQGYIGADGYVDASGAVMLNYLLGSVSESATAKLLFPPTSLLAGNDGKGNDIPGTLRRAASLQFQLVSMLAERSVVNTVSKAGEIDRTPSTGR